VVLGVQRPWNLEVMTSGVFRVSRYSHLVGGPVRDQRSGEAVVVPGEERWQRAAAQRVPAGQVVDTGDEPLIASGVVFYREGISTTVSVLRAVDESLSQEACWVRHTLLVNGKADASLGVLHTRPQGGCDTLLGGPLTLRGAPLAISAGGDTETQVLSGLLPVCVHEGAPRDVLVIGWGSGVSVGATLQAAVSRVVAVELEREVIAAARAFEPQNHAPQLDGRVHIAMEDGRNYLEATADRFDVIISEPSNPWIAGCGNLFTREFFAQVRRRLRPGGVFLQWLQAYEMAPENVWSILGTLADEFQSVHVFGPAGAPSDLLLVARARGGPLAWGSMERCLAIPGVRAELARLGIRGAADLVARLLSGPAGVRRLTATAPRNTDDNARIEFAAPKDLVNYRRYSARRITSELRATLRDARSEVSGLPDDAAARLCWAAARAGRLDAAAASKGTGDAGRCGAAARRLLEKVRPPSRQELVRLLGADRAGVDVRVKRVMEVFSLPEAGPGAPLANPEAARRARLALDFAPDERGAAFAVLGHYLAARGERFRALQYLLAAQADGVAGRYPVQDLVARQYAACRLHARALDAIGGP
jgi:hypothetical protein